MLYGLEELEEILETIFYTAAIKGAVPISVLLIGPSGSAKSAVIKQYRAPQFHESDSFTSQGLFDIMSKDPGNMKRFLLVPDINPSLSRKNSVVQSMMANLLTLTYDGSVRVDDGRNVKECRHDPIALVTAATPEIYAQHAKRWMWLGLRRRIVPLFFTYTVETTARLQELTSNGKVQPAIERKKVRIPAPTQAPALHKTEAREIMIDSERFARMLGKYSFVRQNEKRWVTLNVVPISPQITLRTLAQAHALRARRRAVNKRDIEFIRMFLGYCDPETPKAI